LVDGAGEGFVRVAPLTAAGDVPTGEGGVNAGARLGEPGVLENVGVATMGAAPVHAASSRAVATATTPPAADNSLFLNS
jgi:hypothetical protein